VRQKVIGKPITFELEETATINKSFGSVYVGGENLAHAIVAAGWAKVKPPMGNNVSRTADHEELARLEAEVHLLLHQPHVYLLTILATLMSISPHSSSVLSSATNIL
jgi:hypothetical protein